jgi:hypothetical protein
MALHTNAIALNKKIRLQTAMPMFASRSLSDYKTLRTINSAVQWSEDHHDSIAVYLL